MEQKIVSDDKLDILELVRFPLESFPTVVDKYSKRYDRIEQLRVD
jgi:hypothetical protein